MAWEVSGIKQLAVQFLKFLSVSGIGFIIDFAVYYILTTYAGVPISYANMISAVPAVTWVFVFSTRKIFQASTGNLSVGTKYGVYLLYQIILLVLVSNLAQWLFGALEPFVIGVPLIHNSLKLICKCLITPITMVCNFIVMKVLTEKI